MDDAELRGRFLKLLYDLRDKNGGEVDISAEAFGGGEPVTDDQLFNVARYLSESDFIEFQGLLGSPVIGHAHIKARGIDAIELPETRPSNIKIPEPPRAPRANPVNRTAQIGAALPPFPFNQNGNADMAAARAAEIARRTIAGQAWNNNGYVARPPEEIAKDARIVAMTTSILERPQQVESSVRRVSKEAREFIKEWRAETPNDEVSLRRFNEVTAFLENSAKQLDEIADTIHAVSEAEPGSQSTRVLAGKAAEAFDWLGGQVNNWLENNRGKLPGKLLKASFIIGGAYLLHTLNMDFLISAGIMKVILDDFTDSKSKK